MDLSVTRLSRQTHESRFQALSQVEALPSARDENYRFANLKSLVLDRENKIVLERGPVPSHLAALDEGEAAVFVLESGAGPYPLNQMPNQIQGSLPPGITASFNDGSTSDALPDDLFAQLASARTHSTLHLNVDNGVQASTPLRLLRYFNSESACQFDHVVITVGEGASLVLTDELTGSGLVNGQNPFSSGLIEIRAGKNSRIVLHQLQTLGPAVDSFQRLVVTMEEAAHMTWDGAALGASKSQSRLDISLKGRGAKFLAQGACRGDGEQHFDFWITARHLAPGTESELVFRNVMADAARAVFNGNIIIARNAPQTSASQRNFNMLLSKRAHVATVPKLEIASDDVKCAHGATVSPISEDQIFYLESRGIPRTEALSMIIDGFTRPIIDSFPTPRLRARIDAGLVHKHRGSSA